MLSEYNLFKRLFEFPFKKKEIYLFIYLGNFN